MNKRQQIAIKNPCSDMEQCFNQRFRYTTRKAGYVISTMLTVCVGQELTQISQGRPYWMVSVSLFHWPEPLKTENWTKKEIRMAATACDKALKHVGLESTDIGHQDERMLIIRRCCTSVESHGLRR